MPASQLLSVVVPVGGLVLRLCCTRRGEILSTKVAPAWEKQEPSGLIGPLPAGLRGAGSIHRCLGSAPSCGQGVLRSAPFDMPFLRAPAFPPGAPAPPDGCSAFPLGVLSAHGWAGCDAPPAFLPKNTAMLTVAKRCLWQRAGSATALPNRNRSLLCLLRNDLHFNEPR